MTASEKQARSVVSDVTSAVILTGAAAIRLAIAWAPGEWLLRRVLADDPFYYFTIARNFGRGHGLTFDGVSPTNGFHPLWLLAIAPIFGLVRDAWLAIHLTLTLAALLDVVALWLLTRLLRELGVSGPVVAAVAVCYGASPILLSLAGPLNGLETPLELLLSFAFLTCYRREIVDPRGRLGAAAMGMTAGLLFLARTDNVVLLAFSYAFIAWRAHSDPGRSRRALISAAVAALVAAPWLVWTSVRFGTPIQVSGLAAAHVTRALAAAHGWAAGDYAVKFMRNLATVAAYFPVFRLNTGSLAKAGAANAAVVVVLAVVARLVPPAQLRRNGEAFRRRVTIWLPPLLGGVAFVLVHTVRAVELRGWYYASLLPIAYVVAALVVDEVVRAVGSGGGRVATWAILPVWAAVALAFSWRAGLADRCGEIDGYRMIQAVDGSVPAGTRLGSWNAGLFGYFYRHGEVVDLDGLVDNEAYRHIVDRSVGDYAGQRRIDDLLDAEGAIEFGKPYWNRGSAVLFRPPLVDNRGRAECRRMVLVPIAPR
jgi:hypothetical protein